MRVENSVLGRALHVQRLGRKPEHDKNEGGKKLSTAGDKLDCWLERKLEKDAEPQAWRAVHSVINDVLGRAGGWVRQAGIGVTGIDTLS